MGQRNEKDQKDDTLEWLLNFERLSGQAVVVSLLIENDNVEFLSCINKKRHSAFDTEEPDDSPPSIDLEEARKKAQATALDMQDYIG